MTAEANAVKDNLQRSESGKQAKSDMCLVTVQGKIVSSNGTQAEATADICPDGKTIECKPIDYKQIDNKIAQVRDPRWIIMDPNIDYVPGKNVEECEAKNYSALRDTASRAGSDLSSLDSIAVYMAYVLDPGRPKLPARDIPDELKDKIPEDASDKQVTQICLTEANKYRQDLNQVLKTKGETNTDWSAIATRVQKEINPGFDELVRLSQDSNFNHGNALGKKAFEFATQHAETIDGDCSNLMGKLLELDKHRVEECEDNLPKPLEGVLDNMNLPLSQVESRADKLMMWLKPDTQNKTASLNYDWPMSLRRIKSEAAYINTNCGILDQAMKTNVTLDSNGIDTDINKIERPNLSMMQKADIKPYLAESGQNAGAVTNVARDVLAAGYIGDKWKGLQGEVSWNILEQNKQLQTMVNKLDGKKFDPALGYQVWEKASVLKNVVPYIQEERTMLHDVVSDYMADEAKKKQ
jgi:hypothetical protein